MSTDPKPPQAYQLFVERYPMFARARQLIAEAGRDGPLDPKTARLVKLRIAIGALRESAVRASVRKGLAHGISLRDMEQVVALAAGTIGLPAAVAAFPWIGDLSGRDRSSQDRDTRGQTQEPL